MITFFSIPKPFKGKDAISQRKAILSWKKSSPGGEILLFGNEEGMEDAAKELNALQIREIRENGNGTPYLNFVFEEAKKIAKNNVLVYSNADIIFEPGIIQAIEKIKNLPLYLIIGQRLDLNERGEKRLHGYSGMDYFIFPKNFPVKLPDFFIGRPGWDNWLVYKTHSLKIPIIDATEMIKAIHPDHESSHNAIQKNIFKKEEALHNKKLTRDYLDVMTIREADYLLTKEGLKKKNFPESLFGKLGSFSFWRLLLKIKRDIINYDKLF